jgi:hypothetical protein
MSSSFLINGGIFSINFQIYFPTEIGVGITKVVNVVSKQTLEQRIRGYVDSPKHPQRAIFTTRELAQHLSMPPNVVSVVAGRLCEKNELVHVARGLYRRPLGKDLLVGNLNPTNIGLHNIRITGNRKEGYPPLPTETIPWGRGRNLDIRDENGTIVITPQSITDAPLSIPEFAEMVGVIQGKFGLAFENFNFQLVSFEVNSDEQGLRLDGIQSLKLTVARDQFLRIYEKKRPPRVRFEAHSGLRIGLSEALAIILQMTALGKNTKGEEKENGSK